MYLVSTGKSTVISNFADLETKSTYKHANNETTDFQFYSKGRIFVKKLSEKKSGLEILRLREKPDHEIETQRVRKVVIDNLVCVAAAKKSLEEMAIGLCNGQVKLYNYKNEEFVHCFKAENKHNSVLHLDYNASDEYIASVMENGQINIYGTKTRNIIESINLDRNSTLARFHPSKRFSLAVASYTGNVTVYDVQSKRKIFNSPDSHAAPCRDLCMSAATPDTLISVGYDCVINIFDTRRKTQPVKLAYTHPLSTVALNDCGVYFCVGNLKGELTTYDMRNTKVCLATKKVHNCAVTRVSFVPSQVDSDSLNFLSTAANKIEDQITPETRKTIESKTTTAAALRKRDSFCDFLDYQTNSTREKSSRLLSKRDSFDWETLNRKPNTEEYRTNVCGHSSISSQDVSSACEIIDEKLNSLETNAGEKSSVMKTSPSSAIATIKSPLRDLCNEANISTKINNRKLVQIAEEEHFQIDTTEDKENFMKLDDQLAKQSSFGTSKSENTNGSNTSMPCDNKESVIAKQLAKLNSDMNTRFQQLEGELKCQAETNKWQIFTQAATLWAKPNDHTEEILDGLSILLQTDPFVNEFMRLKKENRMLKAQVLELQKK